MEIASQLSDGVGIIRFDGNLLGEPADSKEFERQLNDLLNRKIEQLFIDLSRVKRINSTGLAILITASTLFTNRGGGKVILAGCNEFIKGALTVTKLDQFFEYFDSIDTAFESLQSIKK